MLKIWIALYGLKNYKYFPVRIFYLTELIEKVKFLTIYLYNNKIIRIINWNRILTLLKTVNKLDNLLIKEPIYYEIKNFRGQNVLSKTTKK